MKTEETNPKHEELLNQLNSVMPIVNYRGCVLTKIIGGYFILRTKVTTLKEVDEVIDRAGKAGTFI